MTDSLAFTAGLPGKRCAAAALFRDGRGRILLVEPFGKTYWDLPGGIVERDESPYATATREVKEELGIVRTLGRLLVVDWFAPVPGLVTEALMFVFDGGVLRADQAAQIQLQHDEIKSWDWVAGGPDADARLAAAPKLHRRIAAAYRAHRDGTTAYLDAGEPTPVLAWPS